MHESPHAFPVRHTRQHWGSGSGVGRGDGLAVGVGVRRGVGLTVGIGVGDAVGRGDGVTTGVWVGVAVGATEGFGVGSTSVGGKQKEPGSVTSAMNAHWSGPHGCVGQRSAP